MTNENQTAAETNDQPSPPATSGTPRVTGRKRWKAAILMALALAAVPVWRATTGHADPPARPEKVPTVAVAHVCRGNLAQQIVCDAELRPYQEVDLHAKVAGYLDKITVDIGDRVKAGQLLATIEVPELVDDLKKATAVEKRNEQEVARAQANYDDANLIYSRLTAVDKSQPNLIAQQELDTTRTKYQTAASALAVAKADVEVAQAEIFKLQTMQKYSQITAPFSGVITKRYADPGALIQTGVSSSTQTLPIVRLSQNDRLRLDIPVSVSYVGKINVGDPVDIRVGALKNELEGKIARLTGKVETATRTMEVEADVPNENLSLIPGMYASVSLRLDHREKTLMVPVQAVSRQKTCTVFVVNKDNSLEERTVSLGLETPQELEILTGVKESELVMVGSRGLVKPGQRVDPKVLEQASAAE